MGLSSPAFRGLLLLLAGAGLAAGIAGGLARLGLPILIPSAAAFHGALMVSGFLGTVIALERAVALGSGFAYLAPLCSGVGAIAVLAGWHSAGALLWLAAPLALFAASVAIAARHLATYTVLLAAAPLAWGAGNVLFQLGSPAAAAWWFVFLVLTIASERLEMTRLTRRPPWAMPLFVALVATLAAGAALSIAAPAAGGVLYGLSLSALAAWLAHFDVARRTLRAQGFARYAAVALFGGYAWLAAAGAAWAFAPQLRDLALHALGLGFVFSMIFAHAPLIVPVVARIRMRFVPSFYLPVALLHVSLAVRFSGTADMAMRALGGALNTAAIALFAGTLAFSMFTSEVTHER